MKKTIISILLWTLAVLITIGAAMYQRMSGPTYPVKIEITGPTDSYKDELPRSHGGETDCPVELAFPEQYSGQIIYKRFNTQDPWDTLLFQRQEANLVAYLPHQPPAGKLEYHVEIFENDQKVETGLSENLIIRFKNDVPAWALIPHIIIMFFSMLWSNVTGLQAASKIDSFRRNALITFILFAVGAFVMGPIVQKYAFGAFWTGWPFGEDLTDNKVLFAAIVWLAALLFNRKKERRWLVIVASIVLFVIFMIPHSIRGSELDYSTGEVVTGSIFFIAASLDSSVKKIGSKFLRMVRKV